MGIESDCVILGMKSREEEPIREILAAAPGGAPEPGRSRPRGPPCA